MKRLNKETIQIILTDKLIIYTVIHINNVVFVAGKKITKKYMIIDVRGQLIIV
jgi:hypothetical protein